MWQILKALKPGAQQAMAGLDNVTADGLQGFKTIENIIANILNDLKKINNLKKKLENGKRYLKLLVLLIPTLSLMLCTTAVSFARGLFVYFTCCIKILS